MHPHGHTQVPSSPGSVIDAWGCWAACVCQAGPPAGSRNPGIIISLFNITSCPPLPVPQARHAQAYAAHGPRNHGRRGGRGPVLDEQRLGRGDGSVQGTDVLPPSPGTSKPPSAWFPPMLQHFCHPNHPPTAPFLSSPCPPPLPPHHRRPSPGNLTPSWKPMTRTPRSSNTSA
jgi:hypothetical protein